MCLKMRGKKCVFVYIYMHKYKIKTHLLQGHKIIYFINDFEKPPTKENCEKTEFQMM